MNSATSATSKASFSGARVVQALVSSTVGQLLTIGQSFLLVPLFLSAWGDEGYGQWASLTALVSYLGLLDLGGQSFVGNRLAEAFACDQREDFRRTLAQGSSLFGAIALGVVLAVGGILLVPGLPWDNEARLVILWNALAFAIAIWGGILVTCYAATGRIVRAHAIGVLSRITIIVASVLELRARFSMPHYALTLLMIGAAGTVLTLVDLRRTIGDLFSPKFAWSELRSGTAMLRGSLGFWLFALAGAANLQGIVLVVSAVSGHAAVAQFITHRAAASLIVYSGNVLRPALWTEMTFMVARSDMARLRSIVSMAIRVSVCTAAVAGAGICVVAPLGYALWTRSKLDLDVVLLIILVTQAIVAAAWSAASWPLMSGNRPRILARWSVVNGGLTLVGACVALNLGYGLRGVGAASLLADICCGLLPIPIASAAFIGASMSAFWRDVARALLCAVPFAGAAFISVTMFDSDLVRLTSFAGASVVLAYPALLLLLGSRDSARIRAAIFKKTGLQPSGASSSDL